MKKDPRQKGIVPPLKGQADRWEANQEGGSSVEESERRESFYLFILFSSKDFFFNCF